MSDRASAELFLTTWQSQDPQKAPLRKFFPPLEDALKLAYAEDLVEQKGKVRSGLSGRGKRYLALLNSDTNLLVEEKRFLASLRPITTSGMWERLGVVKVRERSEMGV